MNLTHDHWKWAFLGSFAAIGIIAAIAYVTGYPPVSHAAILISIVAFDVAAIMMLRTAGEPT